MNLALAGMYVQSVFTRKVIEVLQKLVGPEVSISSMQISRCTALLDTGVPAPWTRHRTGLWMPDMNGCAKRAGWWPCRWRCQKPRCIGAPFLGSLIARGLRGVKFLTSDDHAGLKAARKAMFPGVPWQRCQFHLQHNAQGYVSRLDQRTPVARQIRGIFNAGDAIEAQRLLNAALKDWQLSHLQLAAWAEKKPGRGLCRLWLARGPSGAHAHHKRLGALEQGTHAPNPCCYFVPQP